MLIGPSDMYGDLSVEDVEDFEVLQPNDDREISPEGRFQHGEVRSFDRDFEHELDTGEDEEDLYWNPDDWPEDEYDPEEDIT